MIVGAHTAMENVRLNIIFDCNFLAHDGLGIPALRNYPKPIRTFSEARSIRGVGEKTALKVCYLKVYSRLDAFQTGG